MDIFIRNTYISASSFGFTTTDQTFYGPDSRRIYLVRFLGGNEFSCGIKNFSGFIGINARYLFKSHCKVQKPGDKFISNGNVPGGLITYMHIMPLVVQSLESTAHADNIIIRMRGEDNHSFGERGGTFGVGGDHYIGFATGPAGNGVTQHIIDLQVYFIGITFFNQ